MRTLLAVLLSLLLSASAFAGATYEIPCEKQGLTSGSPTNVMTVNAPDGYKGGGLLVYCIAATNAGNDPIVSCSSQSVAIVNVNGTITATLSTQAAVAEESPGAATISVALTSTVTANTITVRATPTITNYTPTAIVFSIYAILPSSSDLSHTCH